MLAIILYTSAIIIIDDGKFVKQSTPIDPPRITPYQMFIKRSYDNRAERYEWYNNITVIIIIGIGKSCFLHEKCTQLQDTKTS